MWIDSHCHLDAQAFGPDRAEVLDRALRVGVSQLVSPAVRPEHAPRLQAMAHAQAHLQAPPALHYAVGLHPLAVDEAWPQSLLLLENWLTQHIADPLLVAVGEIGLDQAEHAPPIELQTQAYLAQLELAKRFGLPVLLHVRRSAEALLMGLRQRPVSGGIVHAFNGSWDQAQRFVAQGFALGFGGSLSFEGSRNIRRLACSLPEHALVLETDAPDMAPSWLRSAGITQRNEPVHLPRLGAVLAELRGQDAPTLAAITSANVRRVLPRIAYAQAPASAALNATSKTEPAANAAASPTFLA